MDIVTKTPGLQHLSEDIFKLLDKKSSLQCRSVNSFWKNVLEQPNFWLKKLSQEDGKIDEQQQKDMDQDQPDSDSNIIKVDSDRIAESQMLNNNVQKNWKMLAQCLVDDQFQQSYHFVLVLMKMNEQKLIQPLEIVVKLKKSFKYSDLMKFILENEDIHSVGFTPIFLAATYGFTETLGKLLPKYNSSIIEDKNGDTILHIAARVGQIEVIKFMASKVEDLNPENNDGDSPFHLAVCYGKSDVVEYLANKLEDLNAQNFCGDTPMYIAASMGHTDIVKFLASMPGILELNTENLDGDTPIHAAAQEGHTEIVKFFVGINA